MPPSARSELRRTAASLALMLPAMIPWGAHLVDRRPYSLPTGYIQPDMPLYMAKAREAFDGGRFHAFYANPCGPDAGPRSADADRGRGNRPGKTAPWHQGHQG